MSESMVDVSLLLAPIPNKRLRDQFLILIGL